MTFLFSGRLQARHNFKIIMPALSRVLEKRGSVFEFIISGHGEQQRTIDDALERCPGLRPLVRYDRDFASWNDRLRPFAAADVLLYPSQHSGWGLVVPEAMAAGLLVISTVGVESARYFIQHEVNGLLIEPTVEAVEAAIVRCVDNPNWVFQTGVRARESSRNGDAPIVASRLIEAVRRNSRDDQTLPPAGQPRA
jgi:glycosyltransferase involved in cell wall biosynthesis